VAEAKARLSEVIDCAVSDGAQTITRNGREVAEIRHGIELLPAGRRRDRLTTWLAEDLPARFDGRILDLDRQVADAWARSWRVRNWPALPWE
jgi:hypothetical protein